MSLGLSSFSPRLPFFSFALPSLYREAVCSQSAKCACGPAAGGECPLGGEPPVAVKCLLPSWQYLLPFLSPGTCPPALGWHRCGDSRPSPQVGGASPGSQHTSPPLPKAWQQIRELWLEQHLAAGGGAAKRSRPGCSQSQASRGVRHAAPATSGCGIASTLHLPGIIPPGPRAEEPRGAGFGPWKWAGSWRQNASSRGCHVNAALGCQGGISLLHMQ